MLKHWFRGFTKHFLNFKRAILLASVKKVLTVLECRRNHPFFRITPKVDQEIDVAFDSERRVLRCDNGVCQMVVTKFSWFYLRFRNEFPFFLVVKSTLTLGSTAAGHACLRVSLIWVLLNGKIFIASSIAPLLKRPFLWRYNKKTQEQFDPNLLHWVSFDLNYTLQQFLKYFWNFWIRAEGLMSRKWILPAFDRQLGYHQGIVIFQKITPQLSIVDT